MKIPRAFYQIPPEIRRKVKKAIKNIEVAGGSVTVQRARKAGARVQQGHLADIVRWYKQGNLPDVSQDWAETKTMPVDLRAAIERAGTYEDLGNLSKMVMLEIADGNLSPSQATALKGLISEARQALKQGEEKEPDDVEDTLVPVSEEGAELARQFEGIIDEEARQEILDLVKEKYLADLQANPNHDSAK